MPTDSSSDPAAGSRRKLLVLAIDAAEPTLLRALARDGTMPNLASLMESGLTGDTTGIDALYVGATWPSFYTATNPGKHGVYWLEQLVPGTYSTRATRPADFARRPALWDVLSDAGRRVLVLDVPLTRRTPRLNGVQVVEWGVHDAAFGFRTEPPALAARLLREAGPHPAPAACDRPHRSPAEYRAFADQLVRGAARRATLTRALLEREPWDFALQVFSEAHCAGHQLWHYHDPAHPAYDAGVTARDGDLVRDVYAAVDTAVGEIVRSLDDDVTVVVMSLHGMTSMSGYGPLLDQVLSRLGVMARTGDAHATPAAPVAPASQDEMPGDAPMSRDAPNTTAGRPSSIRARVTDLARRAYHHVPLGVRAPLYAARRQVSRRWLGRGTPLDVDPSRTLCFKCEMGPAVSGIRLNLQGRERHGVLRSGAEAERFCEGLVRDLEALVDPDTGDRLVHRVLRSAEHFHGERAGDLPDLVIEWSLRRPVGTTAIAPGRDAVMKASSPRIGVVTHENRYCRTGEHRIEGLFVARGPGIAAGTLPRTASTLDLAPSFARMMGCTMPDVDGTPIAELLATPSRRPTS